jgi:aminopeptidase N
VRVRCDIRAVGLSLLAASLVAAVPLAPEFRLPDDAAPVRQAIELRIDPRQETFEGAARIEIDLRKSTRVVWLNAKDLSIREASIRVGERIQAARAQVVGGEFLGLEIDAPVGPGRALVSIRYQGHFNQKTPAGVFRKKVANDWFVFTTFTPIDARRAFPCFDEPRFKTPWKLTIRVKQADKAFANARMMSEIDEPRAWKAVRFAATAPLPAEVVAFAVGPFEVREAGTDLALRIITPPKRSAEGEEAIRATKQVLPRLEAYTGLRYPYDKLDFVALPEGAFGAVENPGLITFRQRELLVTADKATRERLRLLRGLIAHELAHQWFGNLVTQANWEDVWLSEGFATWLSQRVLDEEQPESRKHLRAVEARERIMEADAGKDTRPVRLAMKSRDDMKGVYSRFVYQKAAAVLLMLEEWIGRDDFRESVRTYLNRNRPGTATTADFAGVLSRNQAAAVLNTFLDQPGIPDVRVTTVCDTAAPARVRIEQTTKGRSWTIPVCWTTDSSKRSCTVLDGPAKDAELESCPTWVFPNAGGTGYYRTQWDADQLAGLTPRLDRLTAAESLTLIYDLGALKRQGRLDADNALRLLGKLSAASEPEIARAAREVLEKTR